MTRYAASTEVSSMASRNEIERILSRYRAEGFVYGWEGDRAIIGFRMAGRQVRFTLPLPPKSDFARTPGKNLPRAADAIEKAWEQAIRQRWRALALVIKAKLEAVDSGITVFEDEFLAHILLPDGKTAGDWLRPQIAIAYETREMPKLLPGPKH